MSSCGGWSLWLECDMGVIILSLPGIISLPGLLWRLSRLHAWIPECFILMVGISRIISIIDRVPSWALCLKGDLGLYALLELLLVVIQMVSMGLGKTSGLSDGGIGFQGQASRNVSSNVCLRHPNTAERPSPLFEVQFKPPSCKQASNQAFSEDLREKILKEVSSVQ